MQITEKKAVQKRSQLKRDNIINALDELLKIKNFDAIGIADVANMADISSATIYQRFDNKHVLISILLSLYLRKVEQWGKSENGQLNLNGADTLYETLIRIGQNAWDQFEALHYIMRPAYLYSRLRPELLGVHWQHQEQKAIAGFEQTLSVWKHELNGKDTAKTAAIIANFFNMMLLGRLLHTDEFSSWNVADDSTDFANQLADFVCGYLAFSKP